MRSPARQNCLRSNIFLFSPSTWSSGILGQKEGLPIQDHSMYFAVELCILLRNYMYVAAELHFHIVAGPRSRPHGGSDRFFGARLSCETKHTMQNLGVCRYGNNQQTCQNSKIHQSSRTAKSAFFSAGPRWDFSVTRGVSRAQNKLWGPLLWQPMYPTLSYNMSKCSD